MNIDKSLEEVGVLFISKQYKNALFLLSQIIPFDKANQEIKILAIICDIASENEERAIFLYDYFMISKNEIGTDKAYDATMNLISAYDGNTQKLADILSELTKSEVESLDAINYDDFLALVENRGSFKLAFEDIMFSTKVALNSRDEFFDFVASLIDNNFSTIAYSYLDGYNQMFMFDKKIEELYKKLEEKNFDNHIQ